MKFESKYKLVRNENAFEDVVRNMLANDARYIPVNSLRPSDAYMRQEPNHHVFR